MEMRTFDELVLIRVRPYGLFEVRDVKGDGNCFYSALALSDELNVQNQEELRHLVAELPLARSLYKRFAKNNTSFDAWLDMYTYILDFDDFLIDWWLSHIFCTPRCSHPSFQPYWRAQLSDQVDSSLSWSYSFSKTAMLAEFNQWLCYPFASTFKSSASIDSKR